MTLRKRIVVPRIVIRNREPAPMNTRVRVQPQHLRWEVGRYRERISSGPGGLGRSRIWTPERAGEQHNLVLDQTYDSLIAQSGFIGLNSYAVVGTGSSAPATTQTGLDAEQVRTNTTVSGQPDEISRVSDGVYRITRYREFSEAQVGGLNLSEWGFSPEAVAGNNLMSRELFRDGSNNPVAITLASDQRLRMIYATQLTLNPVVSQAASINITNLGVRTGSEVLHKLASIYGLKQGAADLYLMDFIARGITSGYAGLVPSGEYGEGSLKIGLWFTATSFARTYDTNTARQNYGVQKVMSIQSYAAGSRQRIVDPVTLQVDQANFTIASLGLAVSDGTISDGGTGGNVGYAFSFVFDAGQEVSKDNLHKLTIDQWTLTWGP